MIGASLAPAAKTSRRAVPQPRSVSRARARPSPAREELKTELHDRYEADAPPNLRRRAEQLYSWFTRAEDVKSS